MVEPLSSRIQINISQPFLMIGQQLTGQVQLDCPNVNADALTLYLNGFDSVVEWKRHLHGKRRYLKRSEKKNQFCRVQLILKQFQEGRSPSMKTSYGFSMILPDDLPPSVLLKSSFVKGMQAQVQYLLEAELTQGNQIQESCSLEVPFYRPTKADKFPEVTYKQEEQVGGYFGYKQSLSKNDITLSSSNICPGDAVKIRICSDQSACNHKIECFKFKLFRRITYNLPDETKFENVQFLSYHMVDGTKRGQKNDTETITIIPSEDPTNQEPLASTVMTGAFSIEYFMRVYVKYKSIFEVGAGHCFNFPVFVLQKPKNGDQDKVAVMGVNQGLPAEFDYHTDDDGDKSQFLHKREGFYEELQKPSTQSYAQNGRDEQLSKQIFYDKIKVIEDDKSTPIPDVNAPEIFVAGITGHNKDSKWIDYANINEPEWRRQNQYASINVWQQSADGTLDGGIKFEQPSMQPMQDMSSVGVIQAEQSAANANQLQ